MKKLCAILLTVVLVCVCMLTSASAKAVNDKITAETMTKISQTPVGEKFEVNIWIYTTHYSSDDITQMAIKELGWSPDEFSSLDEIHRFSQKYNEIAKALESAANTQFIKDSQIPENDVVFISSYTPMIVINANSDMIYQLAENKQVESISYDGYLEPDDPLEDSGLDFDEEPDDFDHFNRDELTDAARRYYSNQKIAGSDIRVLHDHTFYYPLFLLDISVNGVEYVEKTVEIGAYTLHTADSDILIQHGGLYTIKDALKQKIITLKDLSFISKLSWINMEHEEVLGDADASGDLDIIDATFIQRYDVNLVKAYDIDLAMADFNQDGDVDVIDVTYIQRSLNRIIK